MILKEYFLWKTFMIKDKNRHCNEYKVVISSFKHKSKLYHALCDPLESLNNSIFALQN